MPPGVYCARCRKPLGFAGTCDCRPLPIVTPTPEARGLVHGIALALIFWVLIVALALLLQAIT